MRAQLYSRTVRGTPSGRRIDFFENNLRLAKLSLRRMARESLSTETRNGLASILLYDCLKSTCSRLSVSAGQPSYMYVVQSLDSAQWTPALLSISFKIRLIASKLIQAKARSM